MHLTPREQERLLLAAGADLARRRLARGAQLGTTEAIALVCDEVQEMAWDDVPLSEVIEKALAIVPRDRLLPDVTVLVHIARPFGLATAGSAGSVRAAIPDVELTPDRPRATTSLHNRGALAIWVSSHMPLGSLNPALEINLANAGSYRLDVPAGVSVKVNPGQVREVDVVQIMGDR